MKTTLFVLLIVFVVSTELLAQTASASFPYPLGKTFQFLEDEQGKWSIDDVITPDLSKQFAENHTDVLNLGFSDSFFWIRFKLDKHFSFTDQLLLEAGFPVIEQMTLYIPQANGHYLRKEAGYHIPIENRDFEYHNFVFLIPRVNENSFYLRIKSRYAIQLFLNLWSRPTFIQYHARERFLLGLFYGIMIAMILYNLFVFLSTRDSSYGYYVCFITSVSILLMVMNGLIYYFLSFSQAVWWTHRMLIWIGVSFFWGTLFIERILNVRENLPGANKMMIVLKVSSILFILFSVLTPGRWNSILSFVLTVVGAATILTTIACGCLKKSRIAFISLMAFSPLIVGTVIVALGFYGILPTGMFLNSIVNIGITLSTLIFSFGLADQINTTRKQKEQYALELKNKNEKLVDEITERKKSEREIYLLQSQLSNIFNAIPSIIVSVDTQGQIVNWNQQAEARKTSNNPIAKSIDFIDVFPEFTGYWNKIQASIQHGHPEAELKIHSLNNGKDHFDSITISPLIVDKVEGAVIRIDDITDQIRMNEIMIQTEKMMSVGGLAAGMAHEINNPLSGILQATQNILRRISPDLTANHKAAQEYGIDLEKLEQYMEARGIRSSLKGISESGMRAAEIIKNMLHFSQKSQSKRALANLAEVVEKVLGLLDKDYNLKKISDLRQIKINKEIDPDLSLVPCSETEIGQVVFNLVKNAVQAIAEENGSHPFYIFLRLKNDGPMVRIEVEDNGPGMTEAVRKRVFEPFFTTKPVGEGTGLGLSVSYMIITKNHNGTMEVESEPKNGTRFIVRLPVNRSL